MNKKIQMLFIILPVMFLITFCTINYVKYYEETKIKKQRVEDYFEQVENYYDQVSETYLQTNADNLKYKELFKELYEKKYSSKEYLNRYKRCQKLNLILTYNSLVAKNSLDYDFFIEINNNLEVKMKGLKTNLLFSNNKSLLNKNGKMELPDELVDVKMVVRKDCEYCSKLKTDLNLINLSFKTYSFDNQADLEEIKKLEREYGKIVLVPYVIIEDNNVKYGEDKEFKKELTQILYKKIMDIKEGDLVEGKKLWKYYK